MAISLLENDMDVWTREDRDRGLCNIADIGTLKLPEVPSTSSDVKEDAAKVFAQLGRVLYLKNHPRFFHKMLEQALIESPSPLLIQIVKERMQNQG